MKCSCYDCPEPAVIGDHCKAHAISSANQAVGNAKLCEKRLKRNRKHLALTTKGYMVDYLQAEIAKDEKRLSHMKRYYRFVKCRLSELYFKEHPQTWREMVGVYK